MSAERKGRADGSGVSSAATSTREEGEYLLGPCYAEHDPPRPAVELLRLHLPGQPSREVAACEACAEVLRMMAL